MVLDFLMYKVSRLANGLTVATASMPHMASVSVGLWVGVGGRYEPIEICGVSHFIEHLLFKGTRHRSAKQISEDVEGMGGELNAFTCEENTCFYSKARHDSFAELLDVLMDMFLHSRFDPVEIQKERGVIKEELAMYMDQPQHYVQELLNEALWPDHPLGRSLTGTEKSLDYIQRKHLLDFQHTHYVASNSMVTAAGHIDHDQVVRAVTSYARHFNPGRAPGFQPAHPAQPQRQLYHFHKATEQTQIALGIRTCSRHDERRFQLRLLNTLLGENMSSRLFQVIREDRGLAYSICSSLGLFDDVGVLTGSAGLETAKLTQTLKLIGQEMRRLADTLPPRAELGRAKDYLLGQMDLGLESTINQMMWVGEQLLGYGKIIPPATIKQQLCLVKPSDIRDTARAFIKSGRLSLALVSPLKNGQPLQKLVQSL